MLGLQLRDAFSRLRGWRDEEGEWWGKFQGGEVGRAKGGIGRTAVGSFVLGGGEDGVGEELANIVEEGGDYDEIGCS
jgi:hypothetical protein